MPERIFIDGQPADITYDPDQEMYRGEFTELAGAADFYAATLEKLVAEGRTSLKVFLDACHEHGISPSRKRTRPLEALLDATDPRIVEAAHNRAQEMLAEIDDPAPPPTPALRQAYESYQTRVLKKRPATQDVRGEAVSEEAYRAALKEVSALFDMDPEPDPHSEQGKRFDALISAIEAYELLHFDVAYPITTPDGEVVTLSEGVIAGMLPGELLHTPRDSDHWKQWRTAAVEDLPFATRLLAAAARQRLHQSRPEAWQDVVSICREALRISEALQDAGGSNALASLLETMQSLHEVGAIEGGALKSFESTVGMAIDTKTLGEDAQEADSAAAAMGDTDLSGTATPYSPAWVRTTRQRLIVGLADGRWVSCPLAWFPRLQRASQDQLERVELSPLGIHWPEVDEDISASGLLAGWGDMTREAGLRERFESSAPATIMRTLIQGDHVCLLLSDGRCLGIPLAHCTQIRE